MKYIMTLNMLLLGLLLTGCGKNTVVQHPGAIDSLDSKTYDVLLVAQNVLDNAKVAYKQGKLPETAKAAINAGGVVYTDLRELWLEYRAKPDATLVEKITSATLKINQFVLELRGMGVTQ